MLSFLQLFHRASKKYLAVNTTKTSRTENTNLRVSIQRNLSKLQIPANDYIFRLSWHQPILTDASLRFFHATRWDQLEMRCVTMTRSSLRVWKQKVSFFTVLLVTTKASSLCWRIGMFPHPLHLSANYTHNYTPTAMSWICQQQNQLSPLCLTTVHCPPTIQKH